MRAVMLAAILAVAVVPTAWAMRLGRLDPKQLLGPWYVLAVASREKGFVAEKATKNVQGVVVTLTPENNLKVLSSRNRLEGCSLTAVELLKQNSRWVFENPSLGVLEYRVLGTNFKDYTIVFTQLEFGDESFNTVELYSRTHVASQEAMRLFSRWSKNLGYLSQEQAKLQKDLTCAHRILQVSRLQGPHLLCRSQAEPQEAPSSPMGSSSPSHLHGAGGSAADKASVGLRVWGVRGRAPSGLRDSTELFTLILVFSECPGPEGVSTRSVVAALAGSRPLPSAGWELGPLLPRAARPVSAPGGWDPVSPVFWGSPKDIQEEVSAVDGSWAESGFGCFSPKGR
ncbi:epididymal-specific lipocalin-6 [Choloepus didactylus]|uniref:epididymal-specific lipocalin-6 n=1 Tax=Choloepus didactylus TaxID=27675 RepID=UPI00189FFCF4|nr:epididymal-specific lipocalin-6 [Choloepus didactylus]